VAASVVLFFAAALGLAVSTLLLSQANGQTWGEWKRAEDNLVKAKAEQAKAEKEAAKAKAVTRFLTEDLLGQLDAGAVKFDRKVTVEELLNRAEGKLEGAFPDQPEVEAAVRGTIGAVYQSLTLYAKAERHLRRAVALYRSTAGPEHEDTLTATFWLMLSLGWQGKHEEAASLSTHLYEACRRSLGSEHRLTLMAMRGHFTHNEILETCLRVHGPCHGNTLNLMWNMTKDPRGPHQLARAEALSRWCLEVYLRDRGADDLLTMVAVHAISLVLQKQGRLDEAEPLMRQVVATRHRALGPSHADTAHATHLLARLLRSQGRPAEAEPLYREALKNYRPLFGPKSSGYTLAAMVELASTLEDQGKFDEAERFAREALPALRELHPGLHANGLITLGSILTAAGNHADAEPLLREGLKIRREILPKGHWHVGSAESLLGGCLAARKRYAAAEPLLLTGYAALQKDEAGYFVSFVMLREAHERLVKLYEAWDKPDQAKEWRAKEVPIKDQRVLRQKWVAELRQARVKLYRLFRETCPATAERYNQLARAMATAFDPEMRDPQQAAELAQKAVELDPTRGECWGTLGTARYRAGDPKAAIEALQKATQLHEHGANYFFLAMARWRLGDKQQAFKEYAQAVQWMGKNKQSPEANKSKEELRHFRAEAAALLGITDELAGKKTTLVNTQSGAGK
jgi:tetratricopeptide (TPR) repeat protein